MLLGYQTAYSQLVFAGKKSTDPCGDVPDAKVNLAKQLHALSANHPGKVSLRPEKINYMFLRHRPRHLQPPHQKFLLHFQYSH